MSYKISVLTIVHQRARHLQNLIRGLNQSTRLPDELVIIHMNEDGSYALPETGYALRRTSLQSIATAIPLAQARNRAVAEAKGNLLVFLDVDCIPEKKLLEKYERAAKQFTGLLMGDVHYLPAGAIEGNWTYEQLCTRAQAHPRRPVVTQLVQPEARYELFWTLNFALHRTTFEQLGGLDEQYQGYGAEDTDLAFTARRLGIPFALCSARAYHQHHPVYRPPVQHFSDIVVNARRFYAKWQQWPMDGWLRAFAERGLISWDQETTKIEVLRPPTKQETQEAYYKAPAGF